MLVVILTTIGMIAIIVLIVIMVIIVITVMIGIAVIIDTSSNNRLWSEPRTSSCVISCQRTMSRANCRYPSC